MNLFNYFQILLLFAHLRYLYGGGTATQSPSFACAGESITVSCVLTVPNAGDTFDATRPNFIIGPVNQFLQSTQLSEAAVDGTGTTNGFDLSRFTADTNAGNNTVVSGSITLLSYINNTDEGLRMGCARRYILVGAILSGNVFQTLALVQAGLPSIAIPIATIQNFNPSTCEGTLGFNLAATSDRDITSYSILFNGSIIASLPFSNTEFIYNTPFLLNTNYPTSIIATSCAGNSNDGDASVRVNGYMQSDVSCAQYNSVTGALTIDWTVNTPSQPTGDSGINITYSVRVTYSHSNVTVTYLFTGNSNFNLMSTVTTYDVPLTAHNFTNPLGVETNIIAHVRILQQCEQDLVGTELSCSLRSVTSLPDIPTSSPMPSSSIPSSSNSISVIIGSTVGAIVLLLFLSIFIILFVSMIIIIQKKKKEHMDQQKKNQEQGLKLDPIAKKNRKRKEESHDRRENQKPSKQPKKPHNNQRDKPVNPTSLKK